MTSDRTHILAQGGDDPVNETARAAIVGGDGLFMRQSIGFMVSPHSRGMRYWAKDSVIVVDDDAMGARPEPPEGYVSTLTMTEREARAFYEALAEHFGHSVHDVRALRRDYDHERRERGKATDALITLALREPPAPPAPVVNVAAPVVTVEPGPAPVVNVVTEK